jgi:hypothetical protein
MTDGTDAPGAGDPRGRGAGGRDPEAGGGDSGVGGRAPDDGRDPDHSPAGGEDRVGREPVGDPGDHGAYAHATPEQLLGEVRTVRRQARRVRHAYWFPLVLFGLLSCASVPFYIQRFPARSGVYDERIPGPAFLRSIYLGGFGPLTSGRAPYYWLAAMLAGLAATALWYRLRGDWVGLRTPSRGYVITGLVLLVLALLIPVLAGPGGLGGLRLLMPGDLLIRGTFPFVLIAVGLFVLAWAERSIALTVIAAGYFALSLVASLYDIENVFYRLGWTISPANSGLPNVVLPALVLLLSGAGAWVVQRHHRRRSAGPVSAGPVPAGPAPSGQAS